MKNFLFIFLFLFTSSCSNLEFVYKNNENLTNPLYEKTNVSTTGVNFIYMKSFIPMFFGENKTNEYDLSIEIEEVKTNRSVETNQASSSLRYELRFSYKLISKNQNCVSYIKEILSYFMIMPKSEGYNYGTDASLEKKYEIAISRNLSRFISSLSNTNIDSCQ